LSDAGVELHELSEEYKRELWDEYRDGTNTGPMAQHPLTYKIRNAAQKARDARKSRGVTNNQINSILHRIIGKSSVQDYSNSRRSRQSIGGDASNVAYRTPTEVPLPLTDKLIQLRTELNSQVDEEQSETTQAENNVGRRRKRHVSLPTVGDETGKSMKKINPLQMVGDGPTRSINEGTPLPTVGGVHGQSKKKCTPYKKPGEHRKPQIKDKVYTSATERIDYAKFEIHLFEWKRWRIKFLRASGSRLQKVVTDLYIKYDADLSEEERIQTRAKLKSYESNIQGFLQESKLLEEEVRKQ
jgi:hypothetical protein